MARRGRHRPQLEALEDRLTPAFNLTISTAPTGGVVLVNGSFTAVASGANINVAAIQFQLNLGNDVEISNGTGGIEAGNITWFADADLFYTGFVARSLLLVAEPGSTNGAVNVQADVETTTLLNQTYVAQADLLVGGELRAARAR